MRLKAVRLKAVSEVEGSEVEDIYQTIKGTPQRQIMFRGLYVIN